MTSLKTLSAVAILSAAIASPAFAQGQTHHGKAYRHLNAYNHFNGVVYAPPMINEYRGYGEMDRSRVGGEDPDFNPGY
jgi:hypothetical protein